MKKVYKVTAGYVHSRGYDANIYTKNVLADTPFEAAEKVEYKEDEEGSEVLESIELVCVIDIE